MSFEDSDMETTLLVIKECFVYRIPPRATAAGHKAADWDLSNPIWTGRLVVTGKGQNAVVKLEDPQSGDPFAICPVTEASVEPVNDSSRYYVLRIEDGQKRHAFIGMGFAERSEAFDFSAALQDHAKYIKQEKEAQKAAENLATRPHIDYSLKEGEKIKVELKNSAPKQKSSGSSGGFSGGLLPPPPGTRRTVTGQTSAPVQQQFQQQQQQQQSFDPFSGFGQPQPQQYQQQQQQHQGFGAPVQSNDPFASFGFSGNTQQQAPKSSTQNNHFVYCTVF
jgi:hypothetical protein